MTLKQYSKIGMQYRYAASPQMGDALYSTLESANSDEGRAHQRTVDDPKKQVSNAFDQSARQLNIDSWNETNQVPTGGWQSKQADVSLKELILRSPVPVRPDSRAARHGGGYYTKEMIGIDPARADTSILAHEIGHAKNDEYALGRLVQHPALRRMHNLSPLLALGIGSQLEGKGTARALKSLAVALGLSGPTLAGEAAASYHGYKLLKDLGATDEELHKYVKRLVRPQSTYLITPTISTFLAHKMGAAHKLDARRKFKNLLISIETDAGNYRHWHDPHTGEAGKTKMRYPYGYIRKTEGLDGDHVDCFIGPNEQSNVVYIITTNKGPDFKKIDEQKCMLGFDSAEKAKEAFMGAYNDKRFFNKMTAMPYAEFERKVYDTFEQPKKIAVDAGLHPLHTEQTNQGTFNDQVPGDYLGFPAGSLVGRRSVVGEPMQPSDKIERGFRFNDQNMNTTNVDPGASAVPSSPGV